MVTLENMQPTYFDFFENKSIAQTYFVLIENKE